MPGDLVAEGVDRLDVVGHRVVVAVPAQDAGKPTSLLGDWQMSPSLEFGLDLPQLGAHPSRVGDAFELETIVPRPRAYMREAEEGKRLRLAETPLLPISGGEPSELDQARLLSVQLQAELRQSCAEISLEPLGVILMLETHHDVVGEAHGNYLTARVPSPPLVSPQVVD